MSFTKLLRLIKIARLPARLLLSKLTTKHPHVTGEQHLRIIPRVSLGSSLDLINLSCFSCFSTPTEDLSWSRGTCKFSNLSTWHFQHCNGPQFVPLQETISSSSWQGWSGTLLFYGPISGWVPEAKHESLAPSILQPTLCLAQHTRLPIPAVPQMDSPVGPLQWTVSIY